MILHDVHKVLGSCSFHLWAFSKKCKKHLADAFFTTVVRKFLHLCVLSYTLVTNDLTDAYLVHVFFAGGKKCASKGPSVPGRPGYIYLFGENKEWNSSDSLKIFGKVWQFRAVLLK